MQNATVKSEHLFYQIIHSPYVYRKRNNEVEITITSRDMSFDYQWDSTRLFPCARLFAKHKINMHIFFTDK